MNMLTDIVQVENCKCAEPEWHVFHDTDRETLPKNTAGIVFDIRTDKAAISIFDRDTEEYVDGIGTEEHGNIVIVPWKETWFLFCTGSPRIGYIRREE